MKLINSFGYAFHGLFLAIKSQLNLRIHFLISLIVVVAGFYFHITSTEWMVCLIMIAVVVSLELLNTALEELTDLITKEKHPIAGRAKDIAAAAVLFSFIIAVVIGSLVFIKYIFPSN